MGRKMRRVGITFLTAITVFLLCHMVSGAEELKLYQLEEKTQVKEQMDTDSATVVTLDAGTPVLYLEEAQGWIKIRYQDYEGYVPFETNLVNAVDEEEMKEEFKTVEKEFDSLYQGISLQQRKDRQGMLWKIVILVLAVLIIGSYVVLGIIKQMEKRRDILRKEEKEKEDLCQK